MTDSDIQKLLAQYPCTKLADGAYITCPVRLSWISLDKAKPSMSRPEDLRFRATLLFPHNADLSVLTTAASEAAMARWGDKAREVVTNPVFKRPLMPQDAKAGKYDGYVAGAMRSNVTTKRKPVVIGPDRTTLDASNTDVIYPGMWARVKITVRAYDQSGGRGVAFDLVSVQKIADDTPFGGNGVDATDGFTAVAGAAVANGAAGAPVGNKSASALF